MSMVTTALYTPPAPPRAPRAFRMFRLCMMSRVTIMRVRMMLREIEIEKYGMPVLEAREFEMLSGRDVR